MSSTTPGQHEFTVTGSRLLLDSPILAVRQDTVVMPDGEAKREVVEHFGAVAIVAVDKDNRVAMVTQYRHSVRTRLRELPAGLLDFAGEDELECAKRELVEEAGLEASQWSVLCDLVASPGFCEEAVRVFLATDLTEVERPEVEGEEVDMTFEWVDLDQARADIFAGKIANSIAVSGIFAASEVLAGRGQARATSAPFEFRPRSLADRRQEQGIVPDMKKLHR